MLGTADNCGRDGVTTQGPLPGCTVDSSSEPPLAVGLEGPRDRIVKDGICAKMVQVAGRLSSFKQCVSQALSSLAMTSSETQ